jgi:hypothetical protein
LSEYVYQSESSNLVSLSCQVTETVSVLLLFLLFTDCCSILVCRFAYEFGAKCLYSNLPGNLTLISNHREKGENYDVTTGDFARLLNKDMVQFLSAEPPGKSSAMISSFEKRYEVNYFDLLSSLSYFPSFTELSFYQYDFNQRRIGSLSSENPFPLLLSTLSENNQNLIDKYLQESITTKNGRKDERMQQLLSRMNNYLHFSHSFRGSPPEKQPILNKITLFHWLEMKTIIESHLLPSSRMVFIDLIPLVFYFHYYSGLTHNYDYQLVFPSANEEMNLSKTCEFLYSAYERFSVSQLNQREMKSENPVDRIPCIDKFTLFKRKELQDVHLISIPLELLKSTELSVNWKRVLSSNYRLDRLEYLLVIDSCVAAPNLLSIQFPTDTETEFNHQTTVVNSSIELEFYAIEKLCDISNFEDAGTVLYRFVF